MSLRAISIDKTIYNRPIDTPEGLPVGTHLNIQLFLPPSDVPQFISPEYIKDTDTFRINFVYPSLEKEEELFDKNNVRFIIGSSSGKPLHIEIRNSQKDNVRINLVNIITKDIKNMIGEHIRRLTDLRKKTNLERADEILQQNAEELVATM